MKPVANHQHEEHMAPGSLQACLQQLGIPTRLIRTDRGLHVPKDLQAFSGLVLLNSERSALQPIPWIREELALCKDGLAREVPVLGLGYGAQVLTLPARATVKPISSSS